MHDNFSEVRKVAKKVLSIVNNTLKVNTKCSFKTNVCFQGAVCAEGNFYWFYRNEKEKLGGENNRKFANVYLRIFVDFVEALF